MINKRLEETRQEQEEYRKSQSEAGLRGVEAKRKQGIYPFNQSSNPSSNPATGNQALLSSSSSSSIKKELELPDFINSDTWKAFKEHRVQIKRRMTLHAEKLIINKLIKFKEAGHDPNAIINLSIENGWISVFEPKGGKISEADQIRKE